MAKKQPPKVTKVTETTNPLTGQPRLVIEVEGDLTDQQIQQVKETLKQQGYEMRTDRDA